MLLPYADDIDIIGRGLRDVTAAFLRIEKQSAEVGLVINEDKTKLFVSTNKEFTLLGRFVNDVNYNFEVVDDPKPRWIGQVKDQLSKLGVTNYLRSAKDQRACNNFLRAATDRYISVVAAIKEEEETNNQLILCGWEIKIHEPKFGRGGVGLNDRASRTKLLGKGKNPHQAP